MSDRKQKNGRGAPPRKTRKDSAQDREIQNLRRDLKRLSTSGHGAKPRTAKHQKGQNRVERQQKPRASSAHTGLSSASQAFLGVAADSFHPENKEVAHPYGESQPSNKYSCVARGRIGVNANCRVLAGLFPCPNSDQSTLKVWYELASGGLANTAFTTGSAVNVSLYTQTNDSMYTYASSDWDNAAAKYVGGGMKWTFTGNVTTRGGVISTKTQCGNDLITGTPGATLLAVFDEITQDARNRHVTLSQTTGVVQTNHVNTNHDPQFHEYARGTNTLVANKLTMAYTCGQPANVVATTDNGAPVLLMAWENQTPNLVYITIDTIEHHERVSDDYVRLHTASASAPHEAGIVIAAITSATSAHSLDPHGHIATHIAAALTTHKKQTTSATSSRVFSKALGFAMKPKNLAFEEKMAMAGALMV